ncbi:MAG: SCP2 sterol-binding domain-containing protein [Hydrogenophilus sp.]|nr:SCP2 sterol-binding domain-containing protein [Hydrogenophilus sp.]
MQFLSPEWMARYREAWNANEKLVKGLSGFSALIEYGWADGSRPSVFLEVKDGEAVATYDRLPDGRSPDFVMHATEEVWQALRDGSLSGRAALLSRKLKFKGSMITAMRYMGPFEESIRLIGKV